MVTNTMRDKTKTEPAKGCVHHESGKKGGVAERVDYDKSKWTKDQGYWMKHLTNKQRLSVPLRIGFLHNRGGVWLLCHRVVVY